MSTLTEFLLARIAEDEEVARGATAGPWIFDGQGFATQSGELFIRAPYHELDITEEDEAHVARWRPDRVLAECEAKRRIVEAFLDAERAVASYDHAHPTDAYWQEWGNRHALALAVELLGVPYADHPDYDQAWRP